MTKTSVITILLTVLLVSGCAKPAPQSPAPVTQPVTTPPPVVSPAPTAPPQPAPPALPVPQPVTSAAPPLTQPAPEPSGPSSSPGPQLGAVKSPPDRSLVQYALELINKDRADNGLTPVTLGSTTASQIHAEEMLANNYISHWELSGLKPYMRYTLAGGANYESENLFLLTVSGGAPKQEDPKEMLAGAEQALMGSPGHRATILGLQHKKVSLGIAYISNRLALVQQFEGDYVNFSKPPAVNSGVLALSGELAGGLEVGQIQIWYDRLPAPLTIGQLGATATYWRGKPAAFIRPPPPSGAFYPQYETQFSWETSIDPYAIPANTPPPASSGPPETAAPPVTVSDTVRWIDAKTWNISGNSFAIEANLSTVMERFGTGVYTVVIWTKGGAESFTVSNYALFIR